MELREPKKKKRVRLQPQQPYPIIFDDHDNLIKFTAHLNALGTSINEPDDMAAVHSMGFFGKGSLSRSYPAFGRARYGAPPVIRNRQWIQRMKWVEEVKQLSQDSCSVDNEKNGVSIEEATMAELENQPSTSGLSGKKRESESQEDVPEIIDSIVIIDENKSKCKKSSQNRTKGFQEFNDIEIIEPPKKSMKFSDMEVDEVLLDSTEDEDIYEIPKEEPTSQKDKNRSENLWHREELDPSSGDENDASLQGKVLVLPDSDSDTENYLTNILPRVEDDGFPVKETLHLTFEETFFLMYGLGCLQVVNFEGKILPIKESWEHFCKEDAFFIQKYVVYHHFRSKGWVVKPGLKYGGDFLLYKQGPPFYHASYIVIIDVIDAVTLKRIEEKTMRKMTLQNIIGMDRLSESAGKEILMTKVFWPKSVPKDNHTLAIVNLSHFTVKHVLWRRWRIKKSQQASTSAQSEESEDSS